MTARQKNEQTGAQQSTVAEDQIDAASAVALHGELTFKEADGSRNTVVFLGDDNDSEGPQGKWECHFQDGRIIEGVAVRGSLVLNMPDGSAKTVEF